MEETLILKQVEAQEWALLMRQSKKFGTSDNGMKVASSSCMFPESAASIRIAFKDRVNDYDVGSLGRICRKSDSGSQLAYSSNHLPMIHHSHIVRIQQTPTHQDTDPL